MALDIDPDASDTAKQEAIGEWYDEWCDRSLTDMGLAGAAMSLQAQVVVDGDPEAASE
jgi:hypothetical protein